MTSATAHLDSIFRYPVKGLAPERLPAVDLVAGETIPGDRLYAIENGPSGFDPAVPAYFPKTQFLMLMRNERLAALKTRFDFAGHTLVITQDGVEVARASLREASGRAAIEAFFARYSADELRGPPRVLTAPGHSFSNLASVADLSRIIGRPVDSMRFRGNLLVAGWPAWREFDLIDRTLAIGAVRLKVVKRIVRCAATNVDPATAARDMNIPKALMEAFGHADCGVYADVVGDGTITAGDAMSLA